MPTDPTPERSAEEIARQASCIITGARWCAGGVADRKHPECVVAGLREAGYLPGKLRQVGWRSTAEPRPGASHVTIRVDRFDDYYRQPVFVLDPYEQTADE